MDFIQLAFAVPLWIYFTYLAHRVYEMRGVCWLVIGYVGCIVLDMASVVFHNKLIWVVALIFLVGCAYLQRHDDEGPGRRARRAVDKLKGLVPSILPRPYTA